MKTNPLKLTVLAVAAASLFGCASSSGPDLSDARPVTLQRAPLAPLPAEMNSAPSIVVMVPRAGQNVHVSFATLAHQEIQRTMATSGNDVIDRTLTSQARSELEYAEMNGVYRTTGPKIADIAIMGEVSSIAWSASYTPRETYQDRKGRTQTRDAYCRYTGRATINLRAFSLPDMVPLGSYELTGNESSRVTNASSSCPESQGNVASLMTAAVRSAVSSGSDQLLDDLARPFYVTERRQIGSSPREALFYINAGLGQGAERNLTVRFYRVQEHTNDFTGETRREEIQIAEGRVTNHIDQNGAYVLVRGDDMNRIMGGDIARFVRNTCARGQTRVLGMCMSDSLVN